MTAHTSIPPSAGQTNPPAERPRRGRTIPFRVLAVLWAAMLLVGFGTWLSILTPWLELADTADHGWTRTPELHRLADSAAAVIMVAAAVGALILAVRPAGRSGLGAWTAGTLALFGGLSPVSAQLQGHEPTVSTVTAVVWVGLTALTFLVAYPDRRSVLRGGSSAVEVPGARLRAVLTGGAVLGGALAAGAIVWRVSGGVFESPQEDDVISFVILGASFALGCLLCRSGRAGWRTLAAILAGVLLYAVVGAVSIALT